MQSVLWMREFSAFSAFGAVDVGARYNRCGECEGLNAVGAVSAGSSVQSVRGGGGLSAVSTVNGWEGSDGLCAGCGLCAREPLSRRYPGGLSQDFFGLRIEREELVLRPCLGCFLSYKERTEVDKSLYLVKKQLLLPARSHLGGIPISRCALPLLRHTRLLFRLILRYSLSRASFCSDSCVASLWHGDQPFL